MYNNRSLLISFEVLFLEFNFLYFKVLCQIGESARNYCELSGRTEILIGDVVLALINAGIRIDNLRSYGLRSYRTVLPALQTQTQTKQLNILQAGVKQSHPPHIPSHLPPLPDPHAYIRTPVRALINLRICKLYIDAILKIFHYFLRLTNNQ